jgi:hypothetical protein
VDPVAFLKKDAAILRDRRPRSEQNARELMNRSRLAPDVMAKKRIVLGAPCFLEAAF